MEVSDLHRARTIADRRRLVRNSKYCEGVLRALAGQGSIKDEVRRALDPHQRGMKLEERIDGAALSSVIERRDLSGGVNTDGGYLIPEVMSDEIHDRLRAESWPVRLCRVWPLTEGESFRAPSLESTGPARFLNRHEQVEAPDRSFGRSEIPLARLETAIRYSRDLARASGSFSSAISELLADSVSAGLERGVLIGSGVGPEPMGLLLDENVPAVPATFDTIDNGIASAIAALPARMHRNLSIVLHPAAWAQLETENPNAVQRIGRVAYFRNAEVVLSDHAPSAPASGEAFALVGDLRRGVGIAMDEAMYVLPCTELYASTNEILTISGTRAGSGLLTAAALRRVVRS